MADLRSEADWEKVKQKLIEKYPRLTDEDFKEENEEALLIDLGQKLGKSQQEMRSIIKKI